jgi:hypothetical protein
MLGGKVVHRTLAQLKQDLLNQLASGYSAGQALQLGDEDTDTIEVSACCSTNSCTRCVRAGRTPSLLTRLQVPILRVALRDKGFFLRADHPARQLLNTDCRDRRALDRRCRRRVDVALIERVQRAIERVNHEFDSDLKLLERINDDLLLHMQSLARRADVAERRLVDAARGREKLAMARETASRAISNRWPRPEPSRLLRTLLEQAWTDVLALTVLRQGEGSEIYKRQLEVADPTHRRWRRQSGRGHPAARRLVARGDRNRLAQVGYHDDEVRAVVDRVFTPDRAEPTTTAHLPDRSGHASEEQDAPRRDGRGRRACAKRAVAPGEPAAQCRRKRRCSSGLKSTPAGAWFELIGKTANDRTRLKLSWLSPMSGRCLLVNQRGARVDECDWTTLARDIVRRRARCRRRSASRWSTAAGRPSRTRSEQFVMLRRAAQCSSNGH